MIQRLIWAQEVSKSQLSGSLAMKSSPHAFLAACTLKHLLLEVSATGHQVKEHLVRATMAAIFWSYFFFYFFLPKLPFFLTSPPSSYVSFCLFSFKSPSLSTKEAVAPFSSLKHEVIEEKEMASSWDAEEYWPQDQPLGNNTHHWSPHWHGTIETNCLARII